MPVGPFDPFLFVIIGLTVMLSGLILFGIANLRQPVLGQWQWLPLATGLMGFIGFYLFSGAGNNSHLPLFPHPVCSRSYRAQAYPVAGIASSA